MDFRRTVLTIYVGFWMMSIMINRNMLSKPTGKEVHQEPEGETHLNLLQKLPSPPIFFYGIPIYCVYRMFDQNPICNEFMLFLITIINAIVPTVMEYKNLMLFLYGGIEGIATCVIGEFMQGRFPLHPYFIGGLVYIWATLNENILDCFGFLSSPFCWVIGVINIIGFFLMSLVDQEIMNFFLHEDFPMYQFLATIVVLIFYFAKNFPFYISLFKSNFSVVVLCLPSFLTVFFLVGLVRNGVVSSLIRRIPAMCIIIFKKLKLLLKKIIEIIVSLILNFFDNDLLNALTAYIHLLTLRWLLQIKAGSAVFGISCLIFIFTAYASSHGDFLRIRWL